METSAELRRQAVAQDGPVNRLFSPVGGPERAGRLRAKKTPEDI
jgi:hypothetical protein